MSTAGRSNLTFQIARARMPSSFLAFLACRTALITAADTMCCNAFGLGALNVYWLVTGILFAVMNVMPFSTDCTAAMPAWLGVEHECNSLEVFLNLVWCIGIAGWALTCASVAALPLIVTVPPAVNKAAMLGVSLASLIVNVSYIVIAATMTVTAEGVAADLMGTMGTMVTLSLVLWALAFFVHKEPNTGEKMLMF